MRHYTHSKDWNDRKALKSELQKHPCEICGVSTINLKFCSNKCVGIYNKQNPNHGTWNKGRPSSRRGQEIVPREIRLCQVCSAEIRILKTSTKKYCSKKCQAIGSRGKNLVEKVQIKCGLAGCNNTIKISQYAAKKMFNRRSSSFCSKVCESLWRTQRFSGEGNPMFGIKREPHSGNWKKGHISWNTGQGELKRHSCQICGASTLNLKFCSNQCTGEYNKIRLIGVVSKVKGRIKIPRENRFCRSCNKIMFVRQTSSRKYCSRKCQTIGNIEEFAKNGNPYFGIKGGYREDLGHYVRSSWEADFARLWKYLKAPYEYEKHYFDLEEFGLYWPDFYLPDTNHYYEIKGRMDIEFLEHRLRRLYEKYHIQVDMITHANFLWMLIYIREKFQSYLKPLKIKIW